MSSRRTAPWTAPLVCFALVILIAGCRDWPFYGDDLYEVQIENATAVVLVVQEVDAFPNAKPMITRVAPGRVLLSAWRRPRQTRPDERAFVRAEDEAGQLVFCQAFTYADIKRLKQRITIHWGEVRC